MNENESPIELMRRYLDGTATAEETRALEALIVSDSNLRHEFLRYAHLDAALAANLRPALIELPSPAHHQPPIEMRRRGLQWRTLHPLTAAAAGLMFGLFSASVAWAYTKPRVQPIIKQILAIANAGFETDATPVAEGVPTRYGVWSGDHAELTGAQQGVTPKEGKKMFRFVRSDSNRPSDNRGPFNGNIYQVIDLRAWHGAIADGTAMVDWSAWFNSVPESAAGPMKFGTNVWAFSGDTAILPRNWAEKLYQEIAYSSCTVVADNNRESWQRTAGSMIVPPDTDFLVIELKATPIKPAITDGVVVFDGHYADDVQLILRTNARIPSAKQTPQR